MIKLLPNHQAIVDRFMAACQLDDRVLAAFIGGSYASGTADRYSDLDLYVIVADDALDDFTARRNEFLHLLGEPLFDESFDNPDIVFYIFANGAEGELGIGRESEFTHIHGGPYIVLVDKKELLAGVEFSLAEPDPVEQAEKLRRLIYWFWHDLAHFITALERGQLWWAQGQLEVLRGVCVNLARMRHNFLDPDAGGEPYFKVEKVLPIEQLSAFEETLAPIEEGAMLKSGMRTVRFYKEMAVPLAQAHGVEYPQALERVLVQRLEDLQRRRRSPDASLAARRV